MTNIAENYTAIFWVYSTRSSRRTELISIVNFESLDMLLQSPMDYTGCRYAIEGPEADVDVDTLNQHSERSTLDTFSHSGAKYIVKMKEGLSLSR